MALLQSRCKSYALKWTASVVVPDYGLRQLAASSYQECKNFAYNGPTVWNSLPATLPDSSVSLHTFKRRLKTYLSATRWTPSGAVAAFLQVWRRYITLLKYILTYLLTYLVCPVVSRGRVVMLQARSHSSSSSSCSRSRDAASMPLWRLLPRLWSEGGTWH